MKVSLKGQSKKGFFAGTDQVLNLAVLMLLLIGIVLVYAASRDWFAANGLDPEYYLKRQIVNVIIVLPWPMAQLLLITAFFGPTHHFSGALAYWDLLQY